MKVNGCTKKQYIEFIIWGKKFMNTISKNMESFLPNKHRKMYNFKHHSIVFYYCNTKFVVMPKRKIMYS